MQYTALIRLDNVDYEVLIRNQDKTSQWVTIKREMPDDEPRFPQDFEIGLMEYLDEKPELVQALIAGSTIRI